MTAQGAAWHTVAMSRLSRFRSLAVALLIAFVLPLVPAAGGGMVMAMEGMSHASSPSDTADPVAHVVCCTVVCQALPALPSMTAEAPAPMPQGVFGWWPQSAPPRAAIAGPEPPPPRFASVT